MVFSHAHRSRLMVRNLAPKFILMAPVIALFVFCQPLKALAQSMDSNIKKFTKMDFGREPLEIVGIQTKDGPLEIGKDYPASQDWLEGLTITFKNKTGKNITYVSFGLDVREKEGASFLAGDNLLYGKRPQPNETSRNRPPSLEPEKTAEVALTTRSLQDIQKALGNYLNLKDIRTAHLTLMIVIFDDGTRWSGVFLKPDPANPGKFIEESIASKPPF